MILKPRYDGAPIISLDGSPFDVVEPMLRQRRRLEALLGGLSEAQWAAPSRCESWSVRDVIVHLLDTNAFWTFSIGQGVAGKPTRFLGTFDPVASPAALVEAKAALTTEDVLTQLIASNDALAAVLDGLDADGWNALAEAPPGHVSVRAVVHHALWDGWVHERDIALPLGLVPAEQPDEVLAALRYAAALSPAFSLNEDPDVSGTLVIECTEPSATLVVTIADDVHVSSAAAPHGAPVLRGRAVDLVEMLSQRIPLVIDLKPEDLWLFQGLATVFDSEVDLAS